MPRWSSRVMEATKRASSVNPHIGVWVPYVEPIVHTVDPPPIESRIALAPAGWPDVVLDTLYEIYFVSRIAQHVIRNVVKRTTIYDGDNSAVPDSHEPYAGRTLGMPADAYARASRGGGWAALVRVDTTQARRTENGLPRSLRFSLLHELVHAVTITNGCFRAWSTHDRCEAARTGAGSPEEAFAWMIENIFRYEVSGIGRNRYESPSAIPSGALPAPGNSVPGLGAVEQNNVRFAEAFLPRLAHGLAALHASVVPYNPFRDRSRSSHPVAPCQ